MYHQPQDLIIYNIPVKTDSSLSEKEITPIVKTIIEDWAWEGKTPSRIEFMRQEHGILISSYEKPLTKFLPLNSNS